MTPFDANGVEENGEVGFENHSELNPPIEEDKTVEGSCEPTGSPSSASRVNGEGIGAKQRSELSPKSVGSSSKSNLDVNSTPSKGYGLKKWRRIRRDLNKDPSGGADSLQILKRRHSVNEPVEARNDNKTKSAAEDAPGTPTPSVGSLPSVEAVEIAGLDPEIQLVASGGFSIGMDSDNSEDRSSKSSTAASFPKPRHEIGFGRERGRTKIIGGKMAGNSLQQRAQRGRGGGVDSGKKMREGRARLEKENSQSSIESDVRSSNVGFMRWGSGLSNGKQSEKSINFDGEQCDEAQTTDEVRSGYYKSNGVVEDLFRVELGADLLQGNRVKKGNFRPPSGIDPFVESVVMLQAAQEALETEIKKIGDIGKAAESDDLAEQSEETEADSSPILEDHLLALNQKIEHLQCKLEEASAMVKTKELRVIELEEIMKRTPSPKNETSNADVTILEGRYSRELELELEELLMKKMQTEIEILIMSRTTRTWKILTEDQTALLEEQRSLAGDQAQMMLKLREAEDRVTKLKEQAMELELHCKDLLGTEKVLKLQNKVCKFSLCCLVQFLLLCFAFALFLFRMTPPSDEVVPT